jgi:hypothetical protein
MKYNTEIGQARAFEEASFARIEGTLAKQRSRMEQFQIASSNRNKFINNDRIICQRYQHTMYKEE